jgi:hypothetical protein
MQSDKKGMPHQQMPVWLPWEGEEEETDARAWWHDTFIKPLCFPLFPSSFIPSSSKACHSLLIIIFSLYTTNHLLSSRFLLPTQLYLLFSPCFLLHHFISHFHFIIKPCISQRIRKEKEEFSIFIILILRILPSLPRFSTRFIVPSMKETQKVVPRWSSTHKQLSTDTAKPILASTESFKKNQMFA